MQCLDRLALQDRNGELNIGFRVFVPRLVQSACQFFSRGDHSLT
jgi:hypothetical protein